MGKHRWTYNEDLICCREYLALVFEANGNMFFDYSFADIVRRGAIKVPLVEEGSVRMKLQNIKHIALEYGLHDNLPIKPLASYSQQNFRAFCEAVKEINAEDDASQHKGYYQSESGELMHNGMIVISQDPETHLGDFLLGDEE